MKINDHGLTVLVCGGRFYSDRSNVSRVLAVLKRKGYSHVVAGAQTGADTLAATAARKLGMTVSEVPADWDRFGNAAGPIRNASMLHLYKPDLVVAFPGGRGTANMVEWANRAGVRVVDIAAGQEV